MALVSLDFDFMMDGLVDVMAEELVTCGTLECEDLQCRDSTMEDGGVIEGRDEEEDDDEYDDEDDDETYVYEVKEIGPLVVPETAMITRQPPPSTSEFFAMLAEDHDYDDEEYYDCYEDPDELSFVEGYQSSQEEVGYLIVGPPTMPKETLREQMQEQERVKRLIQERIKSYSARQEQLNKKLLEKQKLKQHDQAERLCEIILHGSNPYKYNNNNSNAPILMYQDRDDSTLAVEAIIVLE